MWDLVWKVLCAGFLKFFTPEFTARFTRETFVRNQQSTRSILQQHHFRTDTTKGSTVRIMFFDFSNAFNTIQPHLLIQKLLNMKILSSVISWIFDYLTSRLQYVRLNGFLSSAIRTNTGAPQGTVLAPFLFALYTADSRTLMTHDG